jgi:hypothetical protein
MGVETREDRSCSLVDTAVTKKEENIYWLISRKEK